MNQSVHDFSAFAILITRLEDFILQLCDDGRDEGRLGVGKEGDGGDQGPTVEVDHVLMMMVVIIVALIVMGVVAPFTYDFFTNQ